MRSSLAKGPNDAVHVRLKPRILGGVTERNCTGTLNPARIVDAWNRGAADPSAAVGSQQESKSTSMGRM